MKLSFSHFVEARSKVGNPLQFQLSNGSRSNFPNRHRYIHPASFGEPQDLALPNPETQGPSGSTNTFLRQFIQFNHCLVTTCHNCHNCQQIRFALAFSFARHLGSSEEIFQIDEQVCTDLRFVRLPCICFEPRRKLGCQISNLF